MNLFRLAIKRIHSSLRIYIKGANTPKQNRVVTCVASKSHLLHYPPTLFWRPKRLVNISDCNLTGGKSINCAGPSVGTIDGRGTTSEAKQ